MPPPERLLLLDVLRGFAVFGILVVNMQFFAGPFEWVLDPPWREERDRVALLLIHSLFSGKFYTIFSFLFGLGFAVQMERAEMRGTDRFLSIWLRRLGVLFLIGVAHAALVWYGDILHWYALAGLALFPFRKARTATLLGVGVTALLVPVLLAFAGAAAMSTAPPEWSAPQDSSAIFRTEAALEAYGEGSWLELTRHRVADWLMLDAMSLFTLPSIFALFLFGLAAGRLRIFHEAERYRRELSIALALGLAMGIPLGVLAELTRGASALLPTFRGAVHAFAAGIGSPILSVAFVSGLTLLVLSERWRWRLVPLAAVGQMALTNYLLQSIVCTMIFYSYGLGLFGSVGPAATTVLAIAIFLVQVPLSAWWLSRWRRGPVEAMWRRITYGLRHLTI